MTNPSKSSHDNFGDAGAVLKEVGFQLDHLGIAVRSLEEGFKFYKALGFTQMPTEEVPTEMVRVGFLHLDNQSSIELLEATSDESPIKKFLDKRGPGIHHVCLRVKGIDQVATRLVQSGIKLINEKPRPGAHGCRVVFVHPASTGGVLLELSEPASSGVV